MSELKYRLSLLFEEIWVSIGAYALGGVVVAAIAFFFRDLIPSSVAFGVGADAIDSILNILATSMLAVTTFSLSIMLSAFNVASSSATPRAFLLLKTDTTAQRVLSSFIGTFIFSLVGIISLKIGLYGDGGRVILFAATLLVLALIIVNLVQWISHLTDFGRLSDTMERVENAATDAMSHRLDMPWLGAHPLNHAVPDGAVPVLSDNVGHIRFINFEGLNKAAEQAGATFYVDTLPGQFIGLNEPLVHVAGGPLGPEYEELLGTLREYFSISMTRSFEQDPRFGMIVMSEIASRALSPAVNDPGTAIDAIRRLTRVLSLWTEPTEADVVYPNLFVSGLRSNEMMRDAFGAIARDGAGLYEVQIALQRALLALTRLQPGVFGAGAVDQSDRAMRHATNAMLITEDVDHLGDIADEIAKTARAWQDQGLTGRT